MPTSPSHDAPASSASPSESHPSKSSVSLDPEIYPHLFEAILSHLEFDDLVTVQHVSRWLRDHSEMRLATHIVLSPLNKRAGPCLPTSPPRPFLRRKFWQSSLTGQITIVDYAEDFRRVKAHPGVLSYLHVDMVRAHGEDFDGIPLPTTRQWVSWAHNNGIEPIPHVVTDSVIFTFNQRPADDWNIMPPNRPLNIVIIIEGDWWTMQHGANLPYSDERCICSSATTWPDCNSDCEVCTFTHSDSWSFLYDLAYCIVDQCLKSSLPRHPSITLVGVDRCVDVLAGDLPNGTARGRFLHMLNDDAADLDMEGVEVRKPEEVVRFMSRDEYRHHVGQEVFNLHTAVGY